MEQAKIREILDELEISPDLIIELPDDTPFLDFVENDPESFDRRLFNKYFYQRLKWKGGNLLHMCAENSAEKLAERFFKRLPDRELFAEKNNDGNNPLMEACKAISLLSQAAVPYGHRGFPRPAVITWENIIRLLALNTDICNARNNDGKSALLIRKQKLTLIRNIMHKMPKIN